jgi:hypothetical protein
MQVQTVAMTCGDEPGLQVTKVLFRTVCAVCAGSGAHVSGSDALICSCIRTEVRGKRTPGTRLHTSQMSTRLAETDRRCPQGFPENR